MFFDFFYQALDAVGGLQALAQLFKKPGSVERQGLFLALLEGTGSLGRSEVAPFSAANPN